MSPHAELLKALLPPIAYERNGNALNAELQAVGKQLDNLQAMVQALLLEIDPRTTTQLLPDWERTYGLPDAGLTLPQTVADRQILLAAKVGATGGLSKPYFKALLQAAGYTALIDQPRGFFAGVSCCGDRLYDPAKVTWYWRIRLRKNGQLLTADQRTQVKTWINSVKPAFSFFDLED